MNIKKPSNAIVTIGSLVLLAVAMAGCASPVSNAGAGVTQYSNPAPPGSQSFPKWPRPGSSDFTAGQQTAQGLLRR